MEDLLGLLGHLLGVRASAPDRAVAPACFWASMSGLHVTGPLRLPRCWITNSSGEGAGLM